MIPIMTTGESDSSVQLVGSTPQQTGRSTTVEEMADARPTAHAGPAHQCSPDRGALDSDGYSTTSETAGHRHCCGGHGGVERRSSWLL